MAKKTYTLSLTKFKSQRGHDGPHTAFETVLKVNGTPTLDIWNDGGGGEWDVTVLNADLWEIVKPELAKIGNDAMNAYWEDRNIPDPDGENDCGPWEVGLEECLLEEVWQAKVGIARGEKIFATNTGTFGVKKVKVADLEKVKTQLLAAHPEFTAFKWLSTKATFDIAI